MNGTAFLPVGGRGHEALRLALSEAGLPTDDLIEPGRAFFQLSDARAPVGFVGQEGTGADRLLRSLVVLPGHERQGYGRQLVAHIEAFCRQAGARRLHLLSTDAAGFFQGCGYARADRADAPPGIAATAQFASLCPASATYLVKDFA